MTPDQDPPYGLIAEQLQDGQVVPFLGAAASFAGIPEDREGILPDAGGLAKRLITAWGGYPGGTEAADPLTRVTQFYVDAVASRQDVFERLRKLFFEEQRGLRPAPTAELLARIEPPESSPFLIITTNYDCQLEQALDGVGRPYALVIQDSSPDSEHDLQVWESGRERFEGIEKGSEFDITKYNGKTLVYKLHGGFAHRLAENLDTLVVTEGDYIQFLASVTMEAVPPRSIVRHMLQRRRMLFLGYSLQDWNLRVILYKLQQRRLGKVEGMVKSWGVRNRLDPVERDFWDKREVRLFDMDLADFVTELEARLQAPVGGGTR
ncbi:SIR2 family protein [Kitasatospora sp. NPDC058965]|uniref:SIR2 family NAD-dependent protein deacylase n=1 Tax=Kitasatospora sp. NPDC058965 TaxID=3346682 RepID=UPI00368F4DE5